jgi:hypothetical protein
MNNEGLVIKLERSIRSWYSDVEFELDLLRAYIKSVERLIGESCRFGNPV